MLFMACMISRSPGLKLRPCILSVSARSRVRRWSCHQWFHQCKQRFECRDYFRIIQAVNASFFPDPDVRVPSLGMAITHSFEIILFAKFLTPFDKCWQFCPRYNRIFFNCITSKAFTASAVRRRSFHNSAFAGRHPQRTLRRNHIG